MTRAILLLLGVATLPCAASAQSPLLSAAIGSGQVGERYDGYMGFAWTPSDPVRRQVLGINIQRRNLYTQLATQRNVTAQLVGLTTACTLFAQLPVGEAYMLSDNVWRRRTAGQGAPVPDHCR
ncbi:MAG TPA: YdbL family protein [Sphingomicrobium sp.]